MAAVFDYTSVSQKVLTALAEAFGPNAAIDTDEGWHGRVHVKLVSPFFNGMTEHQKQDLVWEVLKERLGPDAQAVSLVLVYGTDEI